MKKSSTWEFLTSAFARIAILLIVIFFIYNIARSILKNHEVTTKIDAYNNEISYLENDRLNLKNRILFYSTSIYKELEARKHLNYQKKDEHVVVLIKKTLENIEITTELNQKGKDDNQAADEIPNWQKWLEFIFG